MDFENATRRILKLYVLSHCSRCGSAATSQIVAPEKQIEVISEHLVALASAKKRLRDINLSVATWLSDFMDFENAKRRILILYVLSYCSRCGSAATSQIVAPEKQIEVI